MATRNANSRNRRGQRVIFIPYERGGRHDDRDGTPSPSPPDPWELFAERLLNGPYNISHRIPVSPYQPFHVMMDEEEFWNHGRAMSPALQHFVRASPIRFSNRFDDDYGGRQLTATEVETALRKIKADVYTPLSRKSEKENKEEEESDATPHTCSICLEDFFAKQELLSLPCNHKFHSECLMPWIKRQGQCPVCRLDLTGRPASVNNVIQPQTSNGDEMALIIRAMEEAFAWLQPYPR
ncbi:hypothetical protein SUGI_0916220 [Cryptomeria japonica]|uniref:uncharacterized protein LOC131044132 isoform X2 n=1 Tax=Cryptomeria japonica TaxID=3369 RepID=UPI0024147F89|nr:uncharacterized protein LOC131044132 isoform X2 [Cryptomeria japonica]GLJ43949.1 hypothetical protein SUGI_0916220 [Cryptomeria japonica]